jgi:hypothetical protein
LLLGAWMAIGFTLKISLISLSPILGWVIFSKSTSRGKLSAAISSVLGFLITYFMILAIYMEDIAQAFELLKFQFAFFKSPNTSTTYPSWREGLGAYPINIYYYTSALLLSALAIARQGRNGRLLSLPSLWVCSSIIFSGMLFFYLIYKRPHDSSITSISLSCIALFSIAFLTLKVKNSLLILACFLITFKYIHSGFRLHDFEFTRLQGVFAGSKSEIDFAKKFEDEARDAKFCLWFLPGNHWNACLLPQALGYNGGLALRPLRYSGGMPFIENAEAFTSIWPKTVIVGNSSYEKSVIKDAMQNGAEIFWTRPLVIDPQINENNIELYEMLASIGATITERQAKYRGITWIFGTAVIQK